MHPVARLAELENGRPGLVEIADTKILLVREGDVVHALAAECPHAGAPLAEGAVCDGRIVCPWHKASFRLRDGALLEPPALDPLVRYPVVVEQGEVLVSPEPLPQEAAPDPASPDDPRVMLIVGAGAAGTAAACALREFGFAGRVVLIGGEAGEPYDRTALSKFVLQGAMPPDQVPPLREPDFYRTHGIERIHGEAQRLDPVARKLTLSDGRRLDYDAVLVATGGAPRSPQVAGADLPGVHGLRTREDAAAILARLHAGTAGGRTRSGRTLPVVIVGGSFIGLEAASALREQEVPVAVISPHDIPFAAQFGTRIGGMFRRLHESRGVEFIGGRKLAGIEGSAAEGVTGVVLDDGRRIETSLVLVGLGVEPATDFAAGLKRTADGGIIVGADMRAADGAFAAGDVARFPLDGRLDQRVEHWRVAQQHARVAARGMLGHVARLDRMPFFWTYHYGKRYEYLGHPQEFDQVNIDGDLDAGDFLARLTRGGRTVGIVACGRETETAFLIDQPDFGA